MNIIRQILNEQSIICVNKTYRYSDPDVHWSIWAIEDGVDFKIRNIRLMIKKYLMELKK